MSKHSNALPPWHESWAPSFRVTPSAAHVWELPHDGLQQSQYRVAYPAVPVVGGVQATALLDDDDCMLDALELPFEPPVLPDVDVLREVEVLLEVEVLTDVDAPFPVDEVPVV
jgi:hypothetical protein